MSFVATEAITGIFFLSATAIVWAVFVLVRAPNIATTLSELISLVVDVAVSTLSPLLSTKTSLIVSPFFRVGWSLCANSIPS